MKRLMQYMFVLGLCSVFIAADAQAQDDDFRSMVPEAGPAREIEIGTYESFELDNGLKVIVVENHKVPRISYQLFIDRDQIVEGEKAGYVSMAGDLMSTGTATRTKPEIDEAVDFVGGSVSTSSRGGFASSLTKHTDVVLEIFADVILNPSFPEEEFEKLKTQTISGLQANKEDPNAIASNVTSALVYGHDHPYGEMMTELTVENITLDDCKAYYNSYFKPNEAYMVVVGDIKPAAAKKKIEKYFGEWSRGDVPAHEYSFPEQAEAVEVDFVNKTGAVQSVINVTHAIDLEPGEDDVIPARVLNTILGSGFSGRLFRNLREDKAYTYGAYSSLGSDELVGRFGASASVRNEVTDSAITEFMYELNRIRDSLVTDTELELAKNYIAGAFARNLESPQTVAGFALSTARYNLPEDYYNNYLKKLDAVTKEDVQAMAQKYIMPEKARIIVVGNQDEVAEKLGQFSASGDVNFYDIYAKPVAPAEDAGDVTAEDVVNGYIEALGGREALEGVKSMKQVLSASIMGQNLEMSIYKMDPNKVSIIQSVGGQVMSKQAYNGESGYMEQMGQRQNLEGDDLAKMAEEAQMFTELDYLNGDYSLELGGVEDVDGDKCYKLVVTDGSGDKTTEFYSKDSMLKVREIVVEEVNGQSATLTNDFGDYKEVNGIQIPHSVKISGAMPMPLEFTTSEVEINGKFDPEVFN